MIGLLVSLSILIYSYNYAWRHDPKITDYVYYLLEKPYRFLQFFVTLLPIAVGYYFGRARERLLALRALSYDLLSDHLRHKSNPNVDMESFVSDNLSFLTRREREILGLLCQGLTNKEIAALLFISEKTVKNHINSIFKKLNVSDRTNAALLALSQSSERER